MSYVAAKEAMTQMKSKMIAAAAVLALSTTIAIAAPHGEGKFGGHRGHGGEFGAKFAEKLNLTDTQKAQIKAIRTETREQNAAFFDQFRATMELTQFVLGSLGLTDYKFEAQRAQMKQIRDAEKQRILTVLTADQKAQLQQWEAKRAEGHQGKHNRRQQ